MRLKKLLVAFAAVSIVHFSGLLGLLLAQQATGPFGNAAQAAGRADHLATAPDLAALQRRLQSVCQATFPSIVSFGSSDSAAAGVIVAPEGLILTQAHVIGDLKAGSKLWPTLHTPHNDTAAEAEIVGADYLHDLALLRLVKPGPYPFTPLAAHNPAPGTSVLKFGYPGPQYYQKGRPPEVRFGTVLATKSDRFVTDCAINGGDSGGPFVDLDGGVVGILCRTYSIRDVPTSGAYIHNMFNTRGRNWWSGTTSTLIHTRLARMARGEFITPTDAERIQYGADFREKDPILQRDLIPEERWTQGKDMLGRFRGAAVHIRKSVVEILDGDELTALGTVVDAAGLVITKASEVPERARCRLSDGRVTRAEVVGIDPAYDLAVLRVPVGGLVAVTWAKIADLPAGTLLAAVGRGELPVAVGALSVPRRDTPGPHKSAIHRYQRPDLPASPPELTGSTVQGKGFVVETVEGNAAAAGIRPGDVILTLAGRPVPDNPWFKKKSGMNRYDQSLYIFENMMLHGKAPRSGEQVRVQLQRGGEEIQLRLKLPAPSEKESGFFGRVLSEHRDVPPTAITADIAVYHSECGAPVVDIDGKAIGLVISRFGVTGSFIIPGDRVAARLAHLKAGEQPVDNRSATGASSTINERAPSMTNLVP